MTDIQDTVIVSNQIECLICGDRPYSAFRHDYNSCKCGAVSVDGGQEYLRRVGALTEIHELSIIMKKEVVDECIEAVDWALKTNRNSRGITYAILRALRDCGYDLNERENYHLPE